MNKKNILKVLTITAATMAALSSCNQSAPKVDAKSDTPQKVPASLKIAYVEVDSIMSQYKFCKDYSLILQRKGQNIKSTLAAKQQQLQAAAANFQQKMQQNAYTRDQAEAINANLQKQNADLQMLDQRLTTEFQNETHLQQRIETAINQLPPRCKEIFILRKFHHLSQKEVAQKLAISTHSVETQMGIAYAKLRKTLQNIRPLLVLLGL